MNLPKIENYVKPERISLRAHPMLNEAWVQDRIADDPSLLGLGDLVLRQRERRQPRAGRLDLVLADPEDNHRFEVEIQLGATDESHIVRTIEYWDIEKRKYPDYKHTAVIVAEDVTSRFLNVISLFNKSIPLIAIQMQVLKIGDVISLIFTKILDEMPCGSADDNDEVEAGAPADRPYWVSRSSETSVRTVEHIMKLFCDNDVALKPKYNKQYIGTDLGGRVANFMWFVPRKNYCILEIKMQKSNDIDLLVEESKIEMMGYSGSYKLRIFPEDVDRAGNTILELGKLAREQRFKS